MGAVVGFDTATGDTAVCALRDGEILYEQLLGLASDGAPRHSTALLAEVEQAAEAAGGWTAVSRIAVGLGPGSFVGIRIGIATARGLTASTGLPARGVCTLDALGKALGDRTEGDEPLLAVLDARRGEAFAALYAADGARTWEPFLSTPERLGERLATLAAPPLAAGSGAVRFRQELASRGAVVPGDSDPVHRVSARHVCALAESAADGDETPPQPIYLRPPDAQRWRERHDSQRRD